MNLSSLLNDLAGQSNGGLNTIKKNIPGGLASGAVAGGLVALMLGNKSVRKTATTAAKYGGAAVLGGLAFNAYKNWQQSNAVANPKAVGAEHFSNVQPNLANYEKEALEHANGTHISNKFQLALVKAMVASARADGNIDADEQAKISQAIDVLNLDTAVKAELLEVFIQPLSINDIVGDLETMEQKAEAYLASCLVIELDHQAEYVHLSNLSKALELPSGLESQLRAQALEAKSI